MRGLGLIALFGLMSVPAASGQEADRQVRQTVSQYEFETFMSCYGHMAGSLDLLARIRPDIGDPTQIETIRRNGIQLMNEQFAEPYGRLVDMQPQLDLFEGEQARKRGRLPFDSVEMTSAAIQYERFRTLGPLSEACQLTSERVRKRVAGQTQASYQASLDIQD